MIVLWKEKKEGVLSWLILLAVLAVPLIVLAGLALGKTGEYQREIQRDRRILQELRGIEAVQDEIRQVRHAYHERNLKAWAYKDRTSDDVMLDVQRKVTGWLSSAQTQRVTPVTPWEAAEGYEAVGVQVQFIAGLEELLEIIRHVEESRPLLVVERLRITPQIIRATNRNPHPPQRVSVQMTVQTYVAKGG